ncbi:phosphatidate cytidylyltransferase [Pseudoalteromonas denitrificans]|uniref:Phosphatidate cytidylyltransferase n=1 Tax=Pseudoalteromonas denitrificans DSM 6059 TaxID=1123010 RepID=A0A1I1HGE5_9GAMM|nr:phosphatidate cytidylyltransferase [Pseudoalteromonas denitrificans]SFC21058.1 phosphatidate cytidylyltransferase [Pseudoalteromonas denitrificans DSM 6059]
MLKQRIITSMVLAPAALALVFYTPLMIFSYIAALIVLVGAWEWSGFMGLKKITSRFVYVTFIALILTVLHFHWPIELLWQNNKLLADANYLFTLSVAWWLVASALVWQYPSLSKSWNKGILMRALAGFLTLVPLWLALNALRSASYSESSLHGSILIMIVLGIVWSADIGAYFSGKNFGKHKLMPNVSPNKTIEGLAGGVIASTLFILIFCYFAGIEQNKWFLYVCITVFIAIFSAVGDLLESMFKREAGLKDSGRCLPGHGGILDRIDSLTAAAPIFVAFYAWTLNS